jgi:hypothetical protein
MADLPLHEAVVGVMRHFGDKSYFPDGLYQWNLGHPNQLWYYAAYALSWIVSTATACKIVVAAIIVAIPLGAARLADYLGVTRWTALLVAPLGLGWLFFWGLLANMLGLAAFLAVLPTVDAYLKRPDRGGLLKASGAMLLLYFCHEAMLVVACVVIAVTTLLLPWRLWMMVKRVLPAAFGFVMALAQVIYQRKFLTVVQTSIDVVFVSPLYKVKAVPGVLFAGYEELIRDLMFVLMLIPVALFAIERWRSRSRERLPLRERLYQGRFVLIALGLFVCYLALPLTTNGATLVYHRFLPPAYSIAVIQFGAPRASVHARALPRLFAALLPVGSLLIAWPTFVDVTRTYDDLESLLANVKTGQSIAVAELGPVGSHRLWHPQTLEGHVVAVRGGRALVDFTHSSISPVILNRRYVWEDTLVRLRYASNEFRPKHDFLRFHYLLVHTLNPDWGLATTVVLDKESKFLGHRGEWYLFESKLDAIGLLDADAGLVPEERAATLNVRLQRFFTKWNEEHGEHASGDAQAAAGSTEAAPPSSGSKATIDQLQPDMN